MLTNLKYIDSLFYLDTDNRKDLDKQLIYFTGTGQYSKNDSGIYIKGVFPTYSRIKIEEKRIVNSIQ